MKEDMLFSNTMRKILAVFVTSPKERFYLRQLCILIDSAPRPIQLALGKLERTGILNSKREANIKFYSLNEASPIAPEMKSIILKTEAVGSVLRGGLKGLGSVKCAFIYGSAAKGKERQGSDIDICIIGEVDLSELSRVTAKLEEKLKREVSVVTFGPEEWQKAISAKKAFAMDILKNKKIILMGKLDEF